MKRLICIFFSLLLLCGCTQSGRSFSFNRNSLNTSFKSITDRNEYRGSILFDEKNNMHVTISYPDYISGFSLYLTEDIVSSSVNDVGNSYENNVFSDDFALLSLYKAFRKAVTDEAFSKNGDSTYEMTFNDVTLIADKQGNITSAQTKNSSFIFNKQ